MREVIETVADSNAIEVLNENNIITGKGNELFLFSRSSWDRKTVLEQSLSNRELTSKIHGIRKGDLCSKGILLVYGEKEFMLLQYKLNEEEPVQLCFDRAFYRAHLTDWISCGAFLTDCSQLILCTAHSIILRFDYSAENRSCVLRERVSCADKSTLYCAHLYGSTWSDIVVFAGNAFGELLVWQPSQVELTSKCAELIHRVSAHNGVIFSIDYDMESQQLITTSDDRAVKWWQVKFPDDPICCWSGSSLHAVASGYGHVARVFRGRIIRDGSQVYALSVGEDSYFCLWRNNGELLYKRRQQFGATIWNFAYDTNNKTIYTIGSIGNLIAYGLKHILQEALSTQEPLLLPQVSTENSTEYIAKVKFLTGDYSLVLGITNQNRLMSYKKPNKNENDIDCRNVKLWKCTDIDIDFKCTVMEVCSTRIAICGFKRMLLIDWNLNICQFEKLMDIEILQGIIRKFVFFRIDNYLVCDDKGNCRLFSQFWRERSLKLPNCKEPWLTTALLLNADRLLLVSNRQGNLLLYKISDDGSHYLHIDTIKHPHGNLGATNLQLLEEERNDALVRSSGHDGAINVFSVDYNRSTVKFCSREIIPVSWVENIESWFKMPDLFLGFNDNHFVIWCRDYDFLVQLPCGGGHRCWHFELDPGNNEISVVFVKNKRLQFYLLPLYNKEQISLPPPKRWHTAPCNKMVILDDPAKNTSTIAVTAGDDNLIKIHTVTDMGLIQQRELHQHISNVRALKVISLNSTEFLIFSGGGRAQLCITKCNKRNFHVQELLNYTLSKAAEETKYPRNKEHSFDPETRVMALDVVYKSNKGVYHIFIGCSDGFIRVLTANLITLKVKLLTQYFYNRCVLQIEYIPKYKYILAAATDGKIRIFDSSLKKCLHELRHHSSGINALSTFYDAHKKSLKILSGGDDQAVSYTELSLEKFRGLDSFHLPFLHTAQVCAAAISLDGCFGYTSGVDQNVHKFYLTPGSDGTILKTFRSCVADIKGVSLVEYGNKCLIYGCGLQIFSE